jgi:excisionase family DNA binding protein
MDVVQFQAYCAEEAAKRLGISRAELFRLVKSERLHSFKIGKRRLFTDDDLRAFVETCREQA